MMSKTDDRPTPRRILREATSVFTHGTSYKGGREHDRLLRLEPQKFLIEVAVDRPAGGRRRGLPGTWIGVERA
ncbi:hypothetical protein BDQ94DRAFT_151583 [Aspergillus welwitschiae]|uniref:Uncharacterized protein n=1 Tax=Aspergillus welwitschiae TaxID=1341132 RepID=A0A3F3PPC0_9EURO|nr:hypothetical protein BDQ94DRAFT_151583 [Aspergillus welwitschiae]RDH28800.1 hypothetical protein BDQ94DRAFT_151583 [Aspergillus welwitschiae]